MDAGYEWLIKFIMRQQGFILVLILSLAGCASSPIVLSNTKAVPPQEVIVFGRVKVISQDTPVTWGTSQWDQWKGGFTIRLVPEGNPNGAVFYLLLGDGSFYWHLKPGRYWIATFGWSGAINYSGRLGAKLLIAEARSPLYVGTLVVRFVAGMRYFTGVEDEYAQALQELQRKFPELQGEAAKELLQLERPL